MIDKNIVFANEFTKEFWASHEDPEKAPDYVTKVLRSVHAPFEYYGRIDGVRVDGRTHEGRERLVALEKEIREAVFSVSKK